ncbi:ABC transporter ATP-binding protein [Simplicispira lacusdiani]|uniref:ABC transporter ATP-binding protein n=1 Tax=Simplicispira lacusdiani TaxID=2213010 RepID=UPI000E718FBC|nr:ABC transporter ATP-binding protein [Simplicispira lacusdiani]
MTTPLLSIQDLHVRYGGIAALRGLDLTIHAGETVMVTGPNGAGKSTLMKAIAGLVKPRQGRIVFDGQLTTGRAPETVAASGFSLVPEGRQVFGSMTVLENLRIGTGLRRNALAVAADLEYLLDVFPLLRERAHGQAGLLSGGQQQMLVIARALMAAPRLLAIDEPSLGLAPRVTDQVYEALLRLRAERDLTLLIVEQSASRALLTGGRMVMLHEGGIVLEGDPRQITAQQMQQAYFGYDATPAAIHA